MTFRESYAGTDALWFVEKRIEPYYGQYSQTIGSVVVQYLHARRMTRDMLNHLFSEVVQSISSQYKTPPDVAQLRPLVERVQEQYRSAAPPALPEPVDADAAEDGRQLLNRVLSCLRDGRDPRSDNDIKELVEKYEDRGNDPR